MRRAPNRGGDNEAMVQDCRPLLLTMGDPVGIGPEIVARALQQDAAGAVVVGAVDVMRRAMALLPRPWPVARLDAPADVAHCPPRCLPIWQPEGLVDAGLAALPWGQVDARAGAAAAVCIDAAARGCSRGGPVPSSRPRCTRKRWQQPGWPSRGTPNAAGRRRRHAGAHDAGQRRTARGAGDHSPVAAQRDRRRDLRIGAADLRIVQAAAAWAGRASRWRG
jgi:hypothetical protein